MIFCVWKVLKFVGLVVMKGVNKRYVIERKNGGGYYWC